MSALDRVMVARMEGGQGSPGNAAGSSDPVTSRQRRAAVEAVCMSSTPAEAIDTLRHRVEAVLEESTVLRHRFQKY